MNCKKQRHYYFNEKILRNQFAIRRKRLHKLNNDKRRNVLNIIQFFIVVEKKN